MQFTGYHRLEKDLWVDGLRPTARRSPTSCSRTSRRSSTKAKAASSTALSIANGAKALLDEVATDKITGEEERYSPYRPRGHRGELPGLPGRARGAAPGHHRASDPPWSAALDQTFTAINQALDRHKTGLEYAILTEVSADDVKALTVALDALAEEVAKVPAVVESGAGGTPTS